MTIDMVGKITKDQARYILDSQIESYVNGFKGIEFVVDSTYLLECAGYSQQDAMDITMRKVTRMNESLSNVIMHTKNSIKQVDTIGYDLFLKGDDYVSRANVFLEEVQSIQAQRRADHLTVLNYWVQK